MTEVPMNIFISYSVADKAFVEWLAAAIKARGMTPWVGQSNLNGGQNWPNAIETAIERAQAVLVIWTPDARKSKYVQKEYSYAIEHNHRVIPLIVKPCALALLLSDLHWLDFTQVASRAKQITILINALENNENVPPPSTPLPTMSSWHFPVYLLSGVLFLIMVTGFAFVLHGAQQPSMLATPTPTATLTATSLASSTPGGASAGSSATVGTSGTAGSTTKNGASATHTPAPSGSSPTPAPTNPPVSATGTDTPTITPTPTSTRSPQ